ncbi:MAG: glycoside hydrolase family 3 N-terminal domain-containing protein [Terriglobia bacterium]
MSVSRASALGQLLIVGLHDDRWSRSLERMLRALQPSGVLLLPGSLRAPGQTAELLHKIARTLSDPPFLAIAEEGGSVDPLQALLPPLPAPRALARCGPTSVRRSGELIGSALKLLGLNLNFAPRLDLSNPDVKPARDAQTFGPDAKHVAACGKAFIEGLRQHDVLACGKHFPGRGMPEYNENGLPVVGKTMAALWREDLLPFRELLPALRLVKLSNVSYKAYDFDVVQPAAVSSKVVHDLLRVKLGYRGLAVADTLELPFEMSPERLRRQGATLNLSVILNSIRAGCDLQVVSWGPEIAETVFPAMQKELEAGSLTQERVEEALRRIRTVKNGLRRPSGKVSARSFDRLACEFEEFGQRVSSGGDIEA